MDAIVRLVMHGGFTYSDIKMMVPCEFDAVYRAVLQAQEDDNAKIEKSRQKRK